MSGLRFGYGTNGFANHRLADALAVIADLGYDGRRADPRPRPPRPVRARTWPRRVAAVGRPARRARPRPWSIETGARYLLDPWRKHAPTLLRRRARTRGWTSCAARSTIGADLGAEAVSFWAGVRPPDARPGRSPGTGWSTAAPTVVGRRRRAGVPLGLRAGAGHAGRDIAGWRAAARRARRAARRSASPSTSDTAAASSRCRCPTACAAVGRAPGQRADRRHAPGRARAPGVRRRRDRLPAGAARAGRRRLPRPGRGRAAPPLARRARRGRAARSTSCARPSSRGRSWHDTSTSCGGARRWPGGHDVAGRRAATGSRPSPAAIARLFPPAGRRCGRGAAARTRPAGPPTTRPGSLLLAALPAGPAGRRGRRPLYRYGDAAEKRAVLRALPLLAVGDAGVPPAARRACAPTTPGWSPPRSARTPRHLDAAAWRQAVLKCVFMACRWPPWTASTSGPTPSWPRCSPGSPRSAPRPAATMPADAAGPARPAHRLTGRH